MVEPRRWDEDATVWSPEVIQERQLLLLRRRWEVIDQVKDLRTRVPITIVTMILVVTGFVLNSKSLPANGFQRVAIPLVILVLTLVGVMTFWSIHRLYNTMFDQIDYLYRKLGMEAEPYFPTFHRDGSSPKLLFVSVYILLGAVGLMCMIATAIDVPGCPGRDRAISSSPRFSHRPLRTARHRPG